MNNSTLDMKPNILVVDDTPANLQVLSGMLKEKGYKARTVLNGKLALQAVLNDPPDLILLDINMPDMNGFEVCQRLKADPETAQIPIIFISALNEISDIVKGFGVGAVDYIAKPINEAEVLARVKTHLDLRLMQKAQKRLYDQLQEASATKDKFFSIIAHDLRNPFNSLIGFIELILNNIDQYSQETMKKYLNLVLSSSKNLYSLLSNLLSWSQLHRGMIKCNSEYFAVSNMIDECLNIYHSQAGQKGISLINNVPDDLIVYADSNMVKTIHRNLFSNALKYTAAGGTITASAVSSDPFVEISIADTGIGMSPKVLDRLFKIDSTNSTKGLDGETGTGLGLILCKEMVEINGGKIKVESEVGIGTTFSFTLPIGPEAI